MIFPNSFCILQYPRHLKIINYQYKSSSKKVTGLAIYEKLLIEGMCKKTRFWANSRRKKKLKSKCHINYLNSFKNIKKKLFRARCFFL